MLKVHNLKKYYQSQKAVDGISFEVKKGSIFGLLGPNGAGKSSLLRMITGITMPDDGEILFDNKKINEIDLSRNIGYMPEERGMYKKMKVGEQTLYLAGLRGLEKYDAMQKINYWFKKMDMHSWWNKKVEDLSKGMSQKLQFVITVLHQPPLLILDEPFSGLDPVNSDVIKNIIHELAADGMTILFSTHRMEQVEEICDSIVLINQGKTILEGKVHDIKQQFKQHKYNLVCNKPLEILENGLNNGNNWQYQIHANEYMQIKNILQHCIDHQIEIYTLQEILPSLNEIFIKQVEGTAYTRQFEN